MPSGKFTGPLEPAGTCCWRIPKSYKPGMRVDGLIYADDVLIEQIRNDQACEQVANVATLPGIQLASLAMPDIHWGYGFCIGGVCATDPEEGGVISPGGVGYDINCGVRHGAHEFAIRRSAAAFGNAGRRTVRQHSHRRRPRRQVQIQSQGTAQSDGHRRQRACCSATWPSQRDIDFTEAHGCLDGADPDDVSDRALDRGADQCGTLGSGNHFLEVQVVDRVFDEAAAQAMGIAQGTDLRDDPFRLARAGLSGVRRCLARSAQARRRNTASNCPIGNWSVRRCNSPEGKQYLGAMRAAANFAWCNRQLVDVASPRSVFASLRPLVGRSAAWI